MRSSLVPSLFASVALLTSACGAHTDVPGGYYDILICAAGEHLTNALSVTDSGDTPTPGRRSDLAEKAFARVEAKDWSNAVPLLQRVARGEGQDDRGNLQLAQYDLGVTYFHLKHGDLSFEQMKPIALDAGHLKHREALVWMANLALVVPETHEIASPADYIYLYPEEELRPYDVASHRDLGYLLYYLHGRGAYRRGAYIEAMQTMAVVERFEPYKSLTEECDRLASDRLHTGGVATPAQ